MDDKKKKIALGSLVFAIAAVGAFQFTTGSSGPDTTKASGKKVDAKAQDQAKATGHSENLYNVDQDSNSAIITASALPARDPFDGSAWQPKPEDFKPVPEANPEVVKPRASAKRSSGLVPPFNPSMSGIPDINGNTIKFEPGKPAPVEAQFGYGIAGVITGARPAIVVSEPNGVQRIVQLGGHIDGDSMVIGIERGKVTIRFKDKTLTMNVGGTSNEK